MKKGEQSKQRILVAAADLMRARGYHGTGLSDIVRTSGAPKGSLYFHFPGGKEELAVRALARAGAAMRDQFADILEAAPTLAEGTRAVCLELARQLEESDYRAGCPIATVALEAAVDSEAIGEVCSNGYRAWESLLVDKLTGLGADPERARDIALFGLSAVEGGMLLAKAHRSPRPLEAVGDQLAAMIALVLPSPVA